MKVVNKQRSHPECQCKSQGRFIEQQATCDETATSHSYRTMTNSTSPPKVTQSLDVDSMAHDLAVWVCGFGVWPIEDGGLDRLKRARKDLKKLFVDFASAIQRGSLAQVANTKPQ